MHVNMRFFQCILKIPAVSFASKSCPWETSDAPIESQTPTECREIAFAQNELVAPEKKPNPKIENGKKGRDALLRSSQVGKSLIESPSHRVNPWRLTRVDNSPKMSKNVRNNRKNAPTLHWNFFPRAQNLNLSSDMRPP